MDKSLPSFAYLLETDLARKGLSQRELAAKLTEQGEQPLTEQAISSWKSRGKVPGKRMARLLEILGPDSEVGKAHARGDTPTMVGTFQGETVYPVRRQIFKPQPDTMEQENPPLPEEHRPPPPPLRRGFPRISRPKRSRPRWGRIFALICASSLRCP